MPRSSKSAFCPLRPRVQAITWKTSISTRGPKVKKIITNAKPTTPKRKPDTSVPKTPSQTHVASVSWANVDSPAEILPPLLMKQSLVRYRLSFYWL